MSAALSVADKRRFLSKKLQKRRAFLIITEVIKLLLKTQQEKLAGSKTNKVKIIYSLISVARTRTTTSHS